MKSLAFLIDGHTRLPLYMGHPSSPWHLKDVIHRAFQIIFNFDILFEVWSCLVQAWGTTRMTMGTQQKKLWDRNFFKEIKLKKMLLFWVTRGHLVLLTSYWKDTKQHWKNVKDIKLFFFSMKMLRDTKDIGQCWENVKRRQEKMYFLSDKEC